jgi:molybdate transport system substrate-binding protein
MIKGKVIPVSILLLIITFVLLSGCTSPTPAPESTPTPVPKTDLTVFAAASLTSAFSEIKPAFEAAQSGVNVICNFDGSQALRTQIEQGAYADVFASASVSHMNALKNQGLMNNSTVVTFTNNKLAVIVPKDNPAQITGLSDLAKPGLKIVIGTRDVPVGSYTLQILDKMANDTSYGADYKAAVMANVVSQETTVNYVVSKVALGEADAGFVYVSDVPAEYRDRVSTVAIPDSLNVIAVYPIGITADSKYPALAQAFIDFVMSPDGKAILEKNGFSPV